MTVNVHDLTAGLPVEMEPGSIVASLETHGNNVTVSVGDGMHADAAIEAPKVTYKILPPALRTDHAYAIVAKDKEGEESADSKSPSG